MMTATAGSTRTVSRALALLGEVCAQESIGLSECARDEEGNFRAGARLIQLGALTFGRQRLVRIAEPALHRLVGATGESAYLSIAAGGGSAMYVAMVEGTHAVRHTSWVGRSFPMAGLAVGQALSGDVAAAGYVAERDRLEPDVTAIAAPILRPGGVAAAMSLLGPSYRIDDATLHRYGAVLADEARGLSRQLGSAGSVELVGRGAYA